MGAASDEPRGRVDMGYTARMQGAECRVRPATIDDVSVIHAFIQKKAAFDRETGAFSGTLGTTPDRIRATLFGERPFARVLLAELDGDVRGFALFYFRYSSFSGRPSLWLDDLYVDERARSRGAGARLMAVLMHIATEHDCSHLAWTAAVQNPRGIAFYRRLGARIVEQTPVQLTFWWTPAAA